VWRADGGVEWSGECVERSTEADCDAADLWSRVSIGTLTDVPVKICLS